MSNSESTGALLQPTPEGSAILAALAAKYEEPPLSDEELGIVWMQPRQSWPKGLAEKVQALLQE